MCEQMTSDPTVICGRSPKELLFWWLSGHVTCYHNHYHICLGHHILLQQVNEIYCRKVTTLSRLTNCTIYAAFRLWWLHGKSTHCHTYSRNYAGYTEKISVPSQSAVISSKDETIFASQLLLKPEL